MSNLFLKQIKNIWLKSFQVQYENPSLVSKPSSPN